MHSFTIHESRNLKQARPKGQYVDLLRYTLATPSWDYINIILSLRRRSVKEFYSSAKIFTLFWGLHYNILCYKSLLICR